MKPFFLACSLGVFLRIPAGFASDDVCHDFLRFLEEARNEEQEKAAEGKKGTLATAEEVIANLKPQSEFSPVHQVKPTEWRGYYKTHTEQVVRFEFIGSLLVATKVTGDSHIPGGEVTFIADTRTGRGWGQVAQPEFRNSTFVPGKLSVMSRDRIRFEWKDYGSVEFRLDD